MSFIIALHIREGLVMASDSRISFTDTINNTDGSKTIKLGAHISDSTQKTFLTPSNVGISWCGDSAINNKHINWYIENFIKKHGNEDVEIIKDSLLSYFTNLTTNLNTNFFVGGYVNESGCISQKLYSIKTHTRDVKSIDTSDQGALWDGEADIMIRVLNQKVYCKTDDNKYDKIVSYPILWQYFTLQDAVDFARYAIKTTIDTMRFQARVKTVGGSIDILVIKPTEAFWIEKRQLQ